MISAIMKIIDSFSTSVKKDQCYKYLDNIIASLNDDVLPVFDSIIKSKNLPEVKNNKTFTSIYKNCGIVASDNYKALEKMRESFLYISKQHLVLKTLIDKHLQPVLTNKTMSAKSAAIIKLFNDLASMNSYVLDLLYFIIVDEKLSDLPKIKFKSIRDGVIPFADMFKVYGHNFNKTLEDIVHASEEIIPKDSEDKNMLDVMLSKTGTLVTLPVEGFVGNPIYHFRMWLIDRDVAKYESLKVKKQLIELKLVELKLQQEDDSDPTLTKQIKYYEDKLASIEYKIEKLEK